MRMLIARYLDGELGEDEATQFIAALENDPALAAELRAQERIQSAGRSLGGERAPSGFADRVMAKLPRAHRAPAPRRTRFLASRPVWAAAAAIVFAFALGRVSISPDGGSPDLSSQGRVIVASSISAEPIGFVSGPGESQNLRLVQMTYVPDEGSTQSVSVAGTFNGWNPEKVPMREKDGVWTTILVLPPGSYEYMFIEDGERWVTDPLAPHARDDGFGGQNAVLDLGV